MKLSQHFTLAEATRSMTATRCGIDNTPGPDVAKAMINVCENILEPIRKHYDIPFTPSSFYRCPELNEKLGSKNTSQHCKGEAVDIEIPGIANIELARMIENQMDFDQLILEFYIPGVDDSGWVHVSYVSPQDNRHEVLTITKDKTVIGLPD